MQKLVEILESLITAPHSYMTLVDSPKAISLNTTALSWKTGKPFDVSLRKIHRDYDMVVCTCDPWMQEPKGMAIGARILVHEVDCEGKNGGIIKALISIGLPTQGVFYNEVDKALEQAVFVPCIMVAQTVKNPTRFGEIQRWDGGKFADYRSFPKGVISAAPMGAWKHYVELFGI